MRRKVVFVFGLLIAGILAYYSGYYLYRSANPATEITEQVRLQRAVGKVEEPIVLQEYYLGKIEQEMLMIYKMPEESLYDSIKLSSLWLTESEKEEFVSGRRFDSLNEVFEFLENSMS